jgi:hypothetical protein
MGGLTADQSKIRTALRARLQARRTEIEQAVLARVQSIAKPAAARDEEYTESIRSAVAASLDYCLAAVELGGEGSPSIPSASLLEARLAVRHGVSLDEVLRRSIAGHAVFSDFLIEVAAGEERLGGADLQQAMRGPASLFDRLIVAISDEFARESERHLASTAKRRLDSVSRLLAGEPVGASDLEYGFGGWHTGLVARGEVSEDSIRKLANSHDCRLLLVRPDVETAWAWLGRRHKMTQSELARLASAASSEVTFAIGAPGNGPVGWRVTHRQALAALPVALRVRRRSIRYDEIPLLASVMKDDLLVMSLRELYLDPLGRDRDGGAALRSTLDAYFAAGRNVSSAASALGVSRQTVTNRLNAVERYIGRLLRECETELEVALQLNALDDAAAQFSGS